jgi:hypothetical protein
MPTRAHRGQAATDQLLHLLQCPSPSLIARRDDAGHGILRKAGDQNRCMMLNHEIQYAAPRKPTTAGSSFKKPGKLSLTNGTTSTPVRSTHLLSQWVDRFATLRTGGRPNSAFLSTASYSMRDYSEILEYGLPKRFQIMRTGNVGCDCLWTSQHLVDTR